MPAVDPTARVRLTRRVTFASGHRYWIPKLSVEENRELFGRWASPYNHGHNYVLEVTVEGEVDPANSMVVNIKTIDDILDRVVVEQFDQKSINDEIPAFQSQASTLENLMLYIADILRGQLPDAVELAGIRLEEMEGLYGEYLREKGTWTMTITRSYEFAAAHRLHVPTMTEDENTALFGKCNNPAGHGHNYVVDVTVEGDLDARTGMMIDLLKLDEVVEQEVVERYDHKHLNLDLPEFADRAPTSEVIAQEIFKRLEHTVPGTLRRVRLHETARSYFEVLAG